MEEKVSPQIAPEVLPTPVKSSKVPMIIMSIVTVLSLILSGYLFSSYNNSNKQVEEPTPEVDEDIVSFKLSELTRSWVKLNRYDPFGYFHFSFMHPWSYDIGEINIEDAQTVKFTLVDEAYYEDPVSVGPQHGTIHMEFMKSDLSLEEHIANKYGLDEYAAGERGVDFDDTIATEIKEEFFGNNKFIKVRVGGIGFGDEYYYIQNPQDEIALIYRDSLIDNPVFATILTTFTFPDQIKDGSFYKSNN